MSTPLSQLRRIELLERQQAEAAQQLRAQLGRPDVGAGKRWHYLARTVAIGEETYPGDGANTFGLVFLDREYTPTAGSQAVTDAARSNAHQAIGRTINGQWILEGELVEAIPAPPPPGTTDKGRWSIVPLRPYYWGQLSGTLNPSASATVRVWSLDGTNTWVDSGVDQTVWDRSGATIDAGAWILFVWEPNATGGGRWVAVPSAGGRAPTRFKLTENMYTGDAAEAVLRIFNGTTYVDGDAIMVLDWYGWTAHAPGGSRGMFQAASGMEGWAFPREVNGIEGNPLPEYDVVWMEVYAWTINFELTEHMGYSTPGQASATVLASWEQGVPPPSPVTILDSEGLYPRALSGAKGVAIRDEYAVFDEPAAPRYRIVSCQQMSKHAYALLAENLTATGDFDISDFIVTDFSPFNQTPDPVPTTANNLHDLRGSTNDQVTLEWDEDLAKWVIQQVDRQDTAAGESYRTAIGVIGASNLAATNLATNPGNITPTAATNTEGTVPLSSSANNAIFWPDLNGSSQIVFSRNLLADKTFYNATPFAMVSGDRVWVEEFPIQGGTGDARDVDTALGKRWLVRGFQRTKPYALLTAGGWNNSDFKLDWTIVSQKGGLVSLVNSNKHVQFDIPVYQYPFKVTISGFMNWDLGTNPLSIHFQGVLNGFRTDQWMVHFQPVNSPTTVTTSAPSVATTSGPTPDITSGASAGTAHTHTLSSHTHEHNHTHTWAKSDLQIGPKDYDLFSGYGHPWHFDMVGYKPDVSQNDVTWLSITPLGGCLINGVVSGGGSGVQMLIEPMFDG